MLKSYEATLDHGKLQWLGEGLDVVKARIIVIVVEDQSPIRPRPQPPLSIAGKGRTVGDPIEPIVPAEDCECLG